MVQLSDEIPLLHVARSSNRLSERIRPSRAILFLVHDRDIQSLKIGRYQLTAKTTIQYGDDMRTWKTVTPGAPVDQ